MSKFNARERAVNFSFPELRTLLERARSCGKKVYVTFNTLLINDEVDEAAAFLTELAKAPPDALIVQDPGVIQLVNRYFPFFTLHASTQMGIHNSCGVNAMEQLNVKRVILERQITLEELKEIRRKSRLELEVFINGSLCCSLSGRCLLSSFINGTSGNRGRCKQPCRRCYAAVNAVKQDHYLSPYDLDGSSLIPELSAMGIDSFKIEGRLRGSDYIFKTSRAYRMMIDHPDEPEAIAEAQKLLNSSSMRDTSSGFYFAGNYKNLINSNRSGIFGVEIGNVTKSRNGFLAVKTLSRLHLGDRLRAVNEKNKEDVTFSLTKLLENNKSVIKCRAQSSVELGIAPNIKPGSTLYKIGENGFDYRSLEKSLRPGRYPAKLQVSASAKSWKISFSHLPDVVWSKETSFSPAEKRPLTKEEIVDVFSAAPPEPWRIDEVDVKLDGEFFAPGSVLKEMRREFWSEIKNALPPFKEAFSKLEENLKKYLLREKNTLPSQLVELPQDVFTIAAFIPEKRMAQVQAELDKHLATGNRKVAVCGFHGFEMLKNAPSDVEIYTRFPLPVSNHLAAELIQSLGAKAFEAEPELDAEAFFTLMQNTPLPHFELDEPLPVLVTRAELDKTSRHDGSGNTMTVKKDSVEGTQKLYISNCNVRKKFKNSKLL